MAWFYLFIAGIFEIGWPLGFKLSNVTGNKILWITIAAVSMIISGVFLWIAQKEIPIGTAYAVWTGIGASGTFIIGIIFFKDPASLLRMLSFLLIIAGVVGLRFSQ
jgi:quaternary ammonium compound-resistance protein SugE